MKILDLKQGTPEWLSARKGVITGTQLKTVMGRTAKDFMYDLIAQQVSPLPAQYESEHMEHGLLYEDEAIEKYEAETGLITEKVDFCLHEERHWHGLSPDRLVSKEGKYLGAVEVKCPTPKVHLKYVATKEIPAEYKWQVVNYFLVNEEQEWLDFVSYCPQIQIPNLRLSITTVTREQLEEDIEKAEEKLVEFRKDWSALEEKLLF